MDCSHIKLDQRIIELRRRVLARKAAGGLWGLRDCPVVDARSLRASTGAPWPVRLGLLTRDRLSAMRFALDDLELLAGRPCAGEAYSPDEDARARTYLASYPLRQPGQTGHCELDFGPVMQLGIDGVKTQIQKDLARAGGSRAGGSRADAYRSFLHALDGLSQMIDHAAGAAEAADAVEIATAAAPARERELRAIAASCRRIAHTPPASFRDAIQLLWLIVLAIMHGERASLVVPGHLDRTLWPFYCADVDAGVLDRDEALALLESLYLLINEDVPDGLAVSVLVGGRDADGRDVTNELSFLCLEALRRTALIYPTVGVCWHQKTPDALVDLAVDLIAQGYTTPALFGDETIQQGLRALGVPSAEACRYMNSTCVEITPSGGSNVWVASPYYNTCGLLLDEIAAQASDPTATFDLFLDRYQHRLAQAIEEGVAEQDRWRRQRQAECRRPLQSVFTRDCIARGCDIEDGGARYNWVECSFIGLANLADGLLVIREQVYRHQRLSLAGLRALLVDDFAGEEATRQRFLNGYPKYGQGNAQVDGLFAEMIRFIAATCARFAIAPDDSPYVPGAFAWVMHERLGRETGATPDGRRAGFPFADGCGPAQGRERFGPTAATLSVTNWDHRPMIGGLAYNLKFNKSLLADRPGREGLKALLLTYLQRGGFEVQVNVVDNETLRRAQQNPEAYRDLVVRVGGYCDYFTQLSPEMQAELIQRTEYAAF
ncbi:MAG: hypothetical protein JW934_14140 [Anaerolineae bacterium]|nr:hypothetical protein [Anaerolineae bacterium]